MLIEQLVKKFEFAWKINDSNLNKLFSLVIE
jgi:hypothetical protein